MLVAAYRGCIRMSARRARSPCSGHPTSYWKPLCTAPGQVFGPMRRASWYNRDRYIDLRRDRQGSPCIAFRAQQQRAVSNMGTQKVAAKHYGPQFIGNVSDCRGMCREEGFLAPTTAKITVDWPKTVTEIA
eukprot:GFKZ01004105.1.p1 GENE.GFKZ01004105.1~~GFKZ01004105.1.p1  ORF type:complete len:131 (+),score=0.89 GFKZ01004105.1:321-713(+)